MCTERNKPNFFVMDVTICVDGQKPPDGYVKVDYKIGYKKKDRNLYVKTFNPFEYSYKQSILFKYPAVDRINVSSIRIIDVQ